MATLRRAALKRKESSVAFLRRPSVPCILGTGQESAEKGESKFNLRHSPAVLENWGNLEFCFTFADLVCLRTHASFWLKLFAGTKSARLRSLRAKTVRKLELSNSRNRITNSTSKLNFVLRSWKVSARLGCG